jgi:hypothetical protein
MASPQGSPLSLQDGDRVLALLRLVERPSDLHCAGRRELAARMDELREIVGRDAVKYRCREKASGDESHTRLDRRFDYGGLNASLEQVLAEGV